MQLLRVSLFCRGLLRRFENVSETLPSRDEKLRSPVSASVSKTGPLVSVFKTQLLLGFSRRCAWDAPFLTFFITKRLRRSLQLSVTQAVTWMLMTNCFYRNCCTSCPAHTHFVLCARLCCQVLPTNTTTSNPSKATVLTWLTFCKYTLIKVICMQTTQGHTATTALLKLIQNKKYLACWLLDWGGL